MLACAESNFSNFKFEYLRENEFLRKTILACLSGAQMGLIHEKNRGRKSRDTAPLRFGLFPFVRMPNLGSVRYGRATYSTNALAVCTAMTVS